MWNVFPGFAQDIVAHYRRQRRVDRLEALSDHLLQDIGPRRDQLDMLRVTAKPVTVPKEGWSMDAARRPSVQGCG